MNCDECTATKNIDSSIRSIGCTNNCTPLNSMLTSVAASMDTAKLMVPRNLTVAHTYAATVDRSFVGNSSARVESRRMQNCTKAAKHQRELRHMTTKENMVGAEDEDGGKREQRKYRRRDLQ